MPQPVKCPSPRKLEQLRQGSVPFSQVEALARHLEQCETCVRSFQALPGEDTLVEVLRAQTTPLNQADMAVERLVLKLCSLKNPTATMSSTETAAAPPLKRPVKEEYGFLRPPQAPDERGRLGPYRILGVLGAGGMGVVFRAADARLKRQVALKVIKPDKMQSADVHKRFLREAQAIAQLEHENIVTILHVDEVDGVPFLAMPLLRGESLEERLRRAAGPLPLEEMLRIGREIASGLAAAHDRGFVHRDIKPSNVFLTALSSPLPVREQTVREPTTPGDKSAVKNPPARAIILDFGLVRGVSPDEAALSQQGQIIGSPAYMAPEQGRGDTVDHRADLFSLGCVLYRMATGLPPFRAADTVALLLAVALDAPQRPSELNPDLGPTLVRLIEQLLAKKPDQRLSSAHAVVKTIQAIESQLAASQRPRGAHTTLWIGGAAVLLLALVPVAMWFASRRAPSEFLETHANLGQAHAAFVREIGKVTFGSVVTGVAASPRKDESTILASSLDQNGALGVWDGKADVATFPLLDKSLPPMECVAFAPDGIHAATASKKLNDRQELAIYLWDIRKSRPEVVFRKGPLASPVRALAFSPDGKRLLSGDAGGTLLLWNLENGDLAPIKLEGHGDSVSSVAFSADGKKALSGGLDKQAIFWDLETGKVIQRLPDQPDKVRSAVFGPGPNEITTACQDGVIRIRDLSEKKGRDLNGHVGAVNCIAVSPDGKRLLSGGEDGTIRWWDVEAGRAAELSPPFMSGPDAVYSVAFTSDGQRAISGGRDRTLRLWKLPQ